jgi:hypothetical protein
MMAVPNEFFKDEGGRRRHGGKALFRNEPIGLQLWGFSVHSLIYQEVAANKDRRPSHGKHQSL